MRKGFVLILVLLASTAFAETRVYKSNLPLGQFVPKLVDELGNSGFQFSIKSVFNEARDGKQGFVFLLQPRNSLCELVFLPGTANSSMLRIRTQDAADSLRFDKFVSQRLQMKEVGVAPEPASAVDAKWPKP
ncbi:MAG: hypothetical protein JNM27_17420 [Leptospirales bacterium]|nr:hypothetical protein [Leptospirales bacterium]